MRDRLAVQLYTPQNDPPSAQSRSERTPLSQSSRPLALPQSHFTPLHLHSRQRLPSSAKPAPVVRPPNIVVIQFGQHLQAHIDHLKRQILMAQVEYKNVHRSLRKTASIANMSQNRSYANTSVTHIVTWTDNQRRIVRSSVCGAPVGVAATDGRR
ncbi:hypothetical protein BLNAU_355 [Blattamonas nauphoetae]|uniref:Uncharacterized protein n=1 Tax=Blattamonas nauphoetae TaxID=2049346 RepID=A0ABQ9YL08_9EUKA|nr:hypothetical protein BLNAU_355 [Blattamonas nauphoetae]